MLEAVYRLVPGDLSGLLDMRSKLPRRIGNSDHFRDMTVPRHEDGGRPISPNDNQRRSHEPWPDNPIRIDPGVSGMSKRAYLGRRQAGATLEIDQFAG